LGNSLATSIIAISKVPNAGGLDTPPGGTMARKKNNRLTVRCVQDTKYIS